MNLRIAFITDYLSTLAGTESSLVCACEALREHGDDVRVFHYCADAKAHPYWSQRLRDAGIPLVERPCGGNGDRADIELFHREVREYLGNWRPHVVHVLPLEATAGKLLLAEETRIGVPIVGTVTSEPGNRCFWYDRNDFERFAKYDAIVVPGATLVEGIRSFFGYRGPIEVIPHILAVAENEMVPLTPSDLKNMYSLGAITRLRVEKGTEFMVAALSMLKKRFPEISLTIYGETPELERTLVIAQALEVSDRLRIHGPFLAQSETTDIVRQHCIFLLSSLFEGTPMAILESFARGRLVVATNVGGCAELIGRSEAGVLVPPADPQAMAEAVGKLLSHPDDLIARGASGLERFKSFYHPKRVVQRLRQFYARQAEMKNTPTRVTSENYEKLV